MPISRWRNLWRRMSEEAPDEGVENDPEEITCEDSDRNEFSLNDYMRSRNTLHDYMTQSYRVPAEVIYHGRADMPKEAESEPEPELNKVVRLDRMFRDSENIKRNRDYTQKMIDKNRKRKVVDELRGLHNKD